MKYTILFFTLVLSVGCMKPSQSHTGAKLLVLDYRENDYPVQDSTAFQHLRIFKAVDLSDSDKEKLLLQLRDDKNYEPLSRRCEFTPVYALKINNEVTAVFDAEYCPLVRFKNDSIMKGRQLIVDNGIRPLIDSILN